MNRHIGLPIHTGREVLRRACRDRRVALNNLGHHASQGLNPQAQRRYVQQQQIVGRRVLLPRQNLRLHRRSQRYDLVRVQLRVQRLAASLQVEQLRDKRAHGGDARRPTHHHDLVDPLRRKLRILEGLSHRPRCPLHHARDQRLKLFPRDLPQVVPALVFPTTRSHLVVIPEGNRRLPRSSRNLQRNSRA